VGSYFTLHADTGVTMTLSSAPPSMACVPWTVNELLCSASADRCDGGVATNSERGQMGADRFCDVGRREVRVVLFRHARVGMAKLGSNHESQLQGSNLI
jgi:hypothetical protein